MNKILVLWATPRSVSTAFEWMMRQRGDFRCYHEPFGEVWYLGEERRAPRESKKEPYRRGLTFASVKTMLFEEVSKQPVFIKEFAHYIWHLVDDEFLDHFQHTFLIRSPRKSLPAMHHHWPDFVIEETGYAELRALFDRITERDGQVPPVIFADDLQNNAEGTIKAYCKAVGIRFIPDALRWQPGERKRAYWYDGGSWHENLKQSTSIKPQKSKYPPIEENPKLMAMLDVCLPHFEHIVAHALKPELS